MISEAEKEQIRSDAEQLLDSEGRVLVLATKSDGGGGQEETYTPGSEVACNIAPVGSARGASTAGGRINEASTHIATLPHGTAVKTGDRIEVEGVVYSVSALREFGDLSMTCRVEVTRL